MGIMATGGGVYTVMAMATAGIEFFSISIAIATIV